MTQPKTFREYWARSKAQEREREEEEARRRRSSHASAASSDSSPSSIAVSSAIAWRTDTNPGRRRLSRVGLLNRKRTWTPGHRRRPGVGCRDTGGDVALELVVLGAERELHRFPSVPRGLNSLFSRRRLAADASSAVRLHRRSAEGFRHVGARRGLHHWRASSARVVGDEAS
jgi:hypothetical protein